MKKIFEKFAKKAASTAGSPWVFSIAVLTCVLWASLGPIFGFSDTWQLVINTSTTIVTFLMVFLVQSTQNRDTLSLHLKLDELIRSSNARNTMISLDEMTENELRELAKRYDDLGKHGMADVLEDVLDKKQ